jgi:hypothetical protein
MRVVCGAHACKGGWVVVSKDLDSGSVSWRLCATARQFTCPEPQPRIIAENTKGGTDLHCEPDPIPTCRLCAASGQRAYFALSPTGIMMCS